MTSELHWTQSSSTPRSGMYSQLPSSNLSSLIEPASWYPVLQHHHPLAKPNFMSTSTPTNSLPQEASSAGMVGSSPSPLYPTSRDFRLGLGLQDTSSSPISRHSMIPTSVTGPSPSAARQFMRFPLATPLMSTPEHFDSYPGSYGQRHPPPTHYRQATNFPESQQAFPPSAFLHYPAPGMIRASPAPQRRSSGTAGPQTTSLQAPPLSGFNQNGQATRPSPPILPNANARTTQSQGGFPNGFGTQGYSNPSEPFDKKSRAPANFMNQLESAPYFQLSSTDNPAQLAHPTSLAGSVTPDNREEFEKPQQQQYLSPSSVIHDPQNPTGGQDFNSAVKIHNPDLEETALPVTTEAEVQKLLTIALSNSQQRLERSVSLTDIAGNEDEPTMPTSLILPEREKSDDLQSENNNKVLDLGENKLDLKDSVVEWNVEEKLPPQTEVELLEGSLDVSQETRNALESSGSPMEAVGTPVAEEEDEYFPAPSPSEADDVNTPFNMMADTTADDSNQATSNPTESDRLSPDSDDGMTLARFELLTSTIQPDKEGLFFCHLCEFTGKTRQEFHDHLRTHYDYKCPKCDYTSRTEGRLKRHLKDFHSEVPPQNFSGKTARANKPKHLKCKQCEFLAQNKDEYWQHQRLHIKEEKRLECPRCPFVTEYKHHLEYHIRNHFGSKPYKCPKCNYECVNKSMLNSHMKSHTNVYQYRCADCHYATKYCHSLKLHLTKNNHNPATVLNSDGSLPEYDNSSEILNMKRGPPRGPRSSNQRANDEDTGGPLVSNYMGMTGPPGSECSPLPFFAPSGPGSGNPGLWNFLPPGFPPGMPPMNLTGGLHFPKMAGFPQGPIVMPPPSMLAAADITSSNPFSRLSNPPRKPLINPEFLLIHCSLCGTKFSSNEELVNHLVQKHSSEAKATLDGDMSLALDLSCTPKSGVLKRELPTTNSNSTDSTSGRESPIAESSENLSTAECDMNSVQDLSSSMSSRKRPRKSKAFRLDDLCARFTTDNHQDAYKTPTLDEGPDGPQSIRIKPERNGPSPMDRASSDQVSPNQKKDYYECNHCDILFRGRTLFDIHMGYHCHADPFLCNRCGQQSRDSVEFFTHLGELPHA